MANYKQMYIKLFQSQTKAIQLLQEAQQVTEDMYIESEPVATSLFTLIKNGEEHESSENTNQE